MIRGWTSEQDRQVALFEHGRRVLQAHGGIGEGLLSELLIVERVDLLENCFWRIAFDGISEAGREDAGADADAAEATERLGADEAARVDEGSGRRWAGVYG